MRLLLLRPGVLTLPFKIPRLPWADLFAAITAVLFIGAVLVVWGGVVWILVSLIS